MIDQATPLRKRMETRNTRIIAVASGKGGVGKTNISINLGLALEEQGKKVLILDADLGMANVDILLNLVSRYNLGHILKGQCRLEDALIKGPGGLNILSGTTGINDLINIEPSQVERLLDAFTLLEKEFDFIIIDIGAGINTSVINFLRASDDAFIVLTPEPTAIMDAYSLIKYLAKNNFKTQLSLVINQTGSKEEGWQVATRMKRVIKEYLNREIEVLGFIPYDDCIRKAVKKQTAFLISFPGCKAGGAIKDLASEILNLENKKKPVGLKSFIYKMVGMFRNK